MSKKSLTTFEFPKEIQREFHLLMKSKDSFSKKITDAEHRKLETLYAQLNDAWNQNLTGKLMMTLDQKFQELRETQRAIESDFSEYRRELMTKYTTDLEEKGRALELKKMAFEKQKTGFFDFLNKCGNDIKEKEKNWTLQKENSMQELQMNLKNQESQELLLASEREKLSEKLKLKNLILEKQKKLSNEFNSTQQAYQQSINELKNGQEQNLQNLKAKKLQASSKLKSEEEPFQNDLQNLEHNLNSDLSNYEKNLLNELKNEILKEIPDCPVELRNYFQSGDYSSITLKCTALSSETEKLGKALNRELTKIGISVHDFLTKIGGIQTQ